MGGRKPSVAEKEALKIICRSLHHAGIRLANGRIYGHLARIINVQDLGVGTEVNFAKSVLIRV